MSTENLASHTISSVITSVSYPLYAKVQDDKAAMINVIKRLTTTIAYITFPLMFVLILAAKPIFILLYSDRWLASIPYFQVLCVAGLSDCLQAVNTQTIAAIGKSRVMFQWTLIKRAFGLLFIVGGLFLFQMKGLLIGYILNNWFSYFVNIGLVSKYIGYKWYHQLFDLVPMAVVAMVAAGASYLVGTLCGFGLYMDGIVKILVCFGLYLSWSLLFKPESFTYTLSIIPQKFRFWDKINRA